MQQRYRSRNVPAAHAQQNAAYYAHAGAWVANLLTQNKFIDPPSDVDTTTAVHKRTSISLGRWWRKMEPNCSSRRRRRRRSQRLLQV